MRVKRAAVASLAVAVSSAMSVGVATAEPIGSTVKVVNRVTAEYEKDQRDLVLGDGVNQDELIVTGTDAISEFKFLDDTKVALGSGAKLKLDKFVYDPAKADGTIAVELVKGAFRFMTGVAAKPSYNIKTPTASIAVRGTIFDLFVQDDGTTWLLLHEGGVRMCNKRAKCRDLEEPGKLIRVTSNGDVGVPVRWAGLPGNSSIPFDTAFPFVIVPPGIDGSPIFTRDDILRDAEDRTGPKPPKRADGDDDDKPSKTKKPVRVVKTPPPDVPNIKVKVKKPSRSTDDDDDDDYEDKKKPDTKGKPTRVTEKPKKKRGTKVSEQDAEIAKKVIGIGIGIAIGGGFGNKGGNKGGDRPSGGGNKYPGGSSGGGMKRMMPQ